MKLFEVIQRSSRPPRANMAVSADDKAVAGGAYSTVIKAPGSVEKMVKLGRTAREEAWSDGYLAWLEAIHNNPNPFFPVIDKVKIYPQQDVSINKTRTDTQRRQQYQVRMEKLQPLSRLSSEEVQFILSRYFGVNLNDDQKRNIERQAATYPNYKYNPETATLVMGSLIAEILDDIVTHNGCGEVEYFLGNRREQVIPCVSIQDDNLKEALGILKKMKQQGYLPDIHFDNIMARRTPYGPQPVITDPFMYHQDAENQP